MNELANKRLDAARVLLQYNCKIIHLLGFTVHFFSASKFKAKQHVKVIEKSMMVMMNLNPS